MLTARATSSSARLVDQRVSNQSHPLHTLIHISISNQHPPLQVSAPASEPLEFYVKRAHGLSLAGAKAALERFGENKFNVVMPSFIDLYIEGLLAPFSVFQVSLSLLSALPSPRPCYVGDTLDQMGPTPCHQN